MSANETDMSNLTATVSELEESLKVLMFNTDAFFMVIMGIIVFLMQCGFAFLEAGAVRTKNTVNILIKTMVDGLIGAFAYWAVGWAFAYGPSSNGFIGEANFFSYNMDTSKYPNWFFQYVFAATSATIVSGSVAERCQFPAYIFFSFIITGIVYPVITHWVWDSSSPGWLFSLGFHDFAGSGVVHLTGGASSVIACYIIGPRKGRFNADGSINEMPGHSVPLAALGGSILLVCFLAFNGGSQTSISKPGDPDIVALAIINSIIGGSTGGMVVLFYNKYILKQKWSYLMSLNGALAGMVCLCGGCNSYPIWASVIVATFGALVFIGIHFLMLKCKMDDPLDAVAVHFGGGSVGIFFVYVFAIDKGIIWKGNTIEPWYHLGINIAGGVCIVVWTVFWSFIIFYPLKKFNMLRINAQTEFKGMDLTEHGEAAYPADAWVELQYKDDEFGRQSVPAVMKGAPSDEDFGNKRVQSYNLPHNIMPASSVIMKNTKTTFGRVPAPKEEGTMGRINQGFHDTTPV